MSARLCDRPRSDVSASRFGDAVMELRVAPDYSICSGGLTSWGTSSMVEKMLTTAIRLLKRPAAH